jgi:chaperonin cofactor prefoldin
VVGALTETSKERKNIMAEIAALIALARENNEQAKKIRAEVIGMKDALTARITALEEQIRQLNITPEQLAALETELTGAKDVIAEIDALNPDAPAPGA